MDKKTKKYVYLICTLFVVGLIGMLVTGEPAKTMIKNFKSGFPINPSAQQLLGN